MREGKITLSLKIEDEVAKMKRQFTPNRSIFNAKYNLELLDKAIVMMSELIESKYHLLDQIRNLQDADSNTPQKIEEDVLQNYVPIGKYNELLDSHENLMITYNNTILNVKEIQRMNTEKDRNIMKFKKKCTSMHKENRRLRAENKKLRDTVPLALASPQEKSAHI